MSETIEQWSKRRAEDCARCEGILAAFAVLNIGMSFTDRETLLTMANNALSGDWRKQKAEAEEAA